MRLIGRQVIGRMKVLTSRQIGGGRIFFSGNYAGGRHLLVVEPKSKPEHVDAHAVGFIERAAGAVVFGAVVEYAIPVKKECLQLRHPRL